MYFRCYLTPMPLSNSPLALKHEAILRLKEGKVKCAIRALSAKEYMYFDKLDADGWPTYLARNNRWYKAFPPYGGVGSTLWVREYYRIEEDGSISYRVDEDPENVTPRKEWKALSSLFIVLYYLDLFRCYH